MTKIYRPRVCLMCGTEFEPTSPTQKYCVDCGKVNRRKNELKAALRYQERHPEKRREYYRINRERLLEYQHEYYKANRERLNERQREYRRKNVEKPLGCKFEGSCLECPYPECVEE